MIRTSIRFCLGAVMSGLLTTAGCSSKPASLDAASEQALREDMQRVAVEEQTNRRRSTGMTGHTAAQPQAPNFHPEGED